MADDSDVLETEVVEHCSYVREQKQVAGFELGVNISFILCNYNLFWKSQTIFELKFGLRGALFLLYRLCSYYNSL